MLKLRIFLVVLLVLSALGLVTSQHKARKLFVELDRAQAQAKTLDVEWNALQVEQHEFSKSALIDGKARSQLSMRTADAKRTLHLNLSDDARVADRGADRSAGSR